MKKLYIGIVAAGLLASCQQVQGWFGMTNSTDSTQTMTSEGLHKAKLLRDETINTQNAYSDLFLDSAAMEAFIAKEKIAPEKADRMRAFYLVRNNQFAWFTSEGVTEQARGLWSLYESKAEELKNKPSAPLQDRMDSLLSSDSSFTAWRDSGAAKTDTALAKDSATASVQADTTLMQTELALTAQFVDLVTNGSGPITEDNFYWLVPRKKMDATQWADSLLHKEKDSSLWQNNAAYTGLKKSLNLYYTAVQNGGWQPIMASVILKTGVKSPTVVQLKKRLAATGDYAAGDTSDVYSDELAMAVKAVQQQFGQVPTGEITDSLLQELNVPAPERLQQILVNMNRALWLSSPADSSRILVNIPSQELAVYNDTAEVMSMPVIIGKEGSGTMAFNDRITTIVFSPYWNIPKSIVKKDILPAMQKDPSYLKKNNMEIVKQSDSIPEVRQLPGKNNALGRVKFLFPNSFDIYLHDTPHKDLFAQENRALSNGCIRVAYPDSLARFVLRGQAEWTPEKIAAAMNSGKEQKVEIKNPVPVSITYYTAWATENGKLHFRKDVYGYDAKTASRMFTQTNNTATTGLPA